MAKMNGGAPQPGRTPGSSAQQTVLVFQGGGALGAYQAGVYQALHEAGVEPDWIIGTSIGAINAALIAGNAPGNRLARLEEFWRRMAHKSIWHTSAAWPQLAQAWSYWNTLCCGIPGFFEPNPMAFWGTHTRLGPERAGYYSTKVLERTLGDLVDFSLVNDCRPRLTVGAAHVRTSQMRYFDSREMRLGAEHILASGALPPAFPAVRIDGELYWDGGILSNTPTEVIFDDNPRRNSLIFAVHMWNPIGPEPDTMWEVMHRQKDIQYSSRVGATLRASCRRTACATSSKSFSPIFPRTSATARPCANWPAGDASRKCTSFACWHRALRTRTTPKMSISVRRESESGGRRATLAHVIPWCRPPGWASSVHSRASSCTNRGSIERLCKSTAI
jgi:predicted acylesterase/phospholipase RssA